VQRISKKIQKDVIDRDIKHTNHSFIHSFLLKNRLYNCFLFSILLKRNGQKNFDYNIQREKKSQTKIYKSIKRYFKALYQFCNAPIVKFVYHQVILILIK